MRAGVVHHARHRVEVLALQLVGEEGFAGAVAGAPETEDVRQSGVRGGDLLGTKAERVGDLRPGLLVDVVRTETEIAPHHGDPGRVRHRLRHGRAARLEDDGTVAESLRELVDEARLAAAGVAHEGDDLREGSREAVEAGKELGELLLSTDERRQAAGRGDCHRGRRRGQTTHLVGDDRRACAVALATLHLLDVEEPAHQPFRGVADQHRPGLGGRLESLRQVGGVADRRVLHLEIAADGTDHHWSRVHADPNPQLDAASGAELRAQPRERVTNGERGVDGAVRRILVGDRCAEERHDAVAGELDDDALDAVDLPRDERDVFLEEVAILLGIERLGDRGRAYQVAEHDGDELPLAGDGPLTGADLRREGGGNRIGQCRRRGVGSTGALAVAAGTAGVPHSGQKRKSASIACPQLEQMRATRVPHA